MLISLRRQVGRAQWRQCYGRGVVVIMFYGG